LDGRHYFYINPLMLREAKDLRLSTDLPPSEVFIPVQRPEWHDCACCPPNVMRIFSSLSHYLATYDESGIQIHHFATAALRSTGTDSRNMALTMETGYPWSGKISLCIQETGDSPWRLALRVPGWSRNQTLVINGVRQEKVTIENGYLILDRTWKSNDLIEFDLNMRPDFIASNPRIDATRNCLAIQRGPLVYCLEDQDQIIHGKLLDVEIDKDKPLTSSWKSDLLNGVMLIEAAGQFNEEPEWQENLYLPADTITHKKQYRARLLAIPYYAWGNRTIGGMRVWIPVKKD